MNPQIILGPPGTGKTTTLLGIVDDYLKKGVPSYKVGFISFTKKAAEEAVSRACSKFGKEPKEFPYFRTIHSMCFRHLGISTSLLMKREHFRELGQKLGVELSAKGGEDPDLDELPHGDKVLFLEGLARLRCIPLRRQWEEAGLEDVSWWEVDHLARGLEEYKRVHGLLDFTDTLQRFIDRGEGPELECLLVDEAQDLCQLQWRVVKKLASKAKRVVIAGDDDQAIFRWAGADVEHFIGLKGESRVLGHSYRLGKGVHSLAAQVVSGIANRRAKSFDHAEHEATVNHAASLEDLDLSQGSWMVLVRHGYQLRELENFCLREGLDYAVRDRGPRTWDSLKVARTWENLRRGQTVDYERVRDCVKWLRTPVDPRKITKGDWTMALVREATGLTEDRVWHEALRVPVHEAEYLIAALRRKENFLNPPRLRLSTIHGAKGGEADSVALFTDLSARTFQSFTESEDDERRVFYVGVTRARKALHVISPQTSRSFPL